MLYLLIISFFSFSSNKEPVASVAGRKIYKEDMPLHISVDSYVKRLVFFEIAKESGYLEEVKERVDKIFSEKLVKVLYNELIAGEKINPAEPYVLYRRMKKEVHPLVIKTDNFSDAYRAWCEVIRGRDFKEVSEEYSTDVNLKNKKGDIDWIQWTYDPVYLVEKIFSMEKGEMSFPFFSSDGWYVVKVIDLRKKEMPDFEKIKESLVSSIEQKKYRELSNSHINLIKWIQDIEINPEGIYTLMRRVPESGEKRRYGEKPRFKIDDMDVVLARSTLGDYTIGEFNEDIRFIRRLPNLRNHKSARDFVEWRVIYDMLLYEAKKLGLHRKKSISVDYRNELIRQTVSNWKAHELKPEIEITEEDCRVYYQSNKDKYKEPEKRKVHMIRVKDKEEANSLRTRIVEGESFEKIAENFSEDKSSRGRGGLIGYIKEEQRGEIGRVAFEIRKDAISEPFETENGWVIIKVTDIQKSILPEYSKVKYRVTRDVEEDKRIELEDKIFNENKERLDVKIYQQEGE